MAIVECDDHKLKPIQDILDERVRQDEKWSEQNHDPFMWLSILTEEVGEAAKAALHDKFGGECQGQFHTEIIHTAAVALQILEYLDRQAALRGGE